MGMMMPMNIRGDQRGYNNFDDELDMLKLEDGFSQINQSSMMNAL